MTQRDETTKDVIRLRPYKRSFVHGINVIMLLEYFESSDGSMQKQSRHVYAALLPLI